MAGPDSAPPPRGAASPRSSDGSSAPVPATGRWGLTRREGLIVGGLLLAALLLRLPTAGIQSFWIDEIYTARIVDGSLGHAWSEIQRTENTPPLFYLVDWAWAHVVGRSELGLRSLSAIAGTLAVLPTMWLARTVGRSPRVAPATPSRSSAAVPFGVVLLAGVLVAVNPLAQWFSQEARAYGLVLLTGAFAWGALMLALERPTSRRLWLWAAAAVLVTWTHYFGGLLLVIGAVFLVLDARRRDRALGPRALRPLVAPLLASVVGAAALLPIARNQQSTDMYTAISQVKSLGTRIFEVPKQLAVGYNAPTEYVLGLVVAVVLLALAVVAAWPRDGRPTRATALAGGVFLVWLLPLVGVALGFDVILARNYVILIPALAVLVAIGAWRVGRRAFWVVGVIAVIQVVVIALVVVTPRYQRDDWRGIFEVARAPGPELVLISRFQGPTARYYGPRQERYTGGYPVVRSVALIDRPDKGGLSAPEMVPAPPPPAPGMKLVRQKRTAQYRAYVWTSPTPVAVNPPVTGGQLGRSDRTALLLP